jgi:hypothetical protein
MIAVWQIRRAVMAAICRETRPAVKSTANRPFRREPRSKRNLQQVLSMSRYSAQISEFRFMRRHLMPVVIAAALLAPAHAELKNSPSRSAKVQTFIIPSDEGYGMTDCLRGHREAGSCGQVIADSYCEAQGFARAEHFGQFDASDVTGSVPVAAGRPAPRTVLAITCKP